MPFDGPDVHHRDLPDIPKEGPGMADYFQIPDSADHVYYFSDASLRCAYYLRVHLPDEDAYRDYKAHMLTKRRAIPAEADDPPDRLRKRFDDWWDWRSRAGAESFAFSRSSPDLPLLDFIVFDDAERTVFCLMQED
jgi:hypothetical protein